MPTSNKERLELIEWCRFQKLHHTAVGLQVEAFATDPKLAVSTVGGRTRETCIRVVSEGARGEVRACPAAAGEEATGGTACFLFSADAVHIPG